MSNKNKLPILKENEVINKTTCFYEHEKRNLTCLKKSCKHWMNVESSNNCSVIKATKGPMSMTDIALMLDQERKDICKTYKSSKNKITKSYLSD